MLAELNLDEVCERVRLIMVSEFPHGLTITRDYDASVPEFRGDKEQLIQALLNIVRNAAQVTIARARHRLVLDLHVIDNGPGIPDELKERIFFPLVSGREGGNGLGLTLAQTFVQQHDGMIEVDSRTSRTNFRILIPLQP